MNKLNWVGFFLAVLFSSFHASVNAVEILVFNPEDRIKDSYIVKLKEETIDSILPRGSHSKIDVENAVKFQSLNISSQYGGVIKNHYDTVFKGFSIQLDESQANLLANDPRIEYVAEDGFVYTSTIQTNATWGLDRIDQRGRNLNGEYQYTKTGAGVNVYVVDSGINTNHIDFGGRAKVAIDLVNDGRQDCSGHGTHVAGTIGGSNWGVAKQSNLLSVRVFGCDGSTSISNVIKAVDWVGSNGIRPAVVNMSLGGGKSQPLKDAVNGAINRGFTFIISAGNENLDACNRSPADVADALTVGAIDKNDKRASFSNYGQCVDLFAPGHEITSASHTSTTGSRTLSGTSMAAPHVAGIAALYLQDRPSVSPNDVVRNVMYSVTYGLVTDKQADTPNLLAYSKEKTNGIVPFFRYSGINDHFYTTNWNELGSGHSSEWQLEGIVGYISIISQNGSKVLYRYYSSKDSDHFYTTNYGELGQGNEVWRKEQDAGYLPLPSSKTQSLYRYYANSVKDHFYTPDFNELGSGNSTWKYEGVVGQVYKSPE
ncbi:MAG: S8 family serine peptidase [Gammaproteobacteria bacterium]|nr:S8 family serine peptidase [Gammaproteobacteria bacterium]